MRKGKLAVNCSLLVLLCIVIGAVLITVANYLPINEGNKNLSLEQIAGEGEFPEIPSLQGEYGSFISMNPTALELATDSLMLKMTLYEGEDEGIIQAFRCYSTQYEEEYSRYWHGYVVILRLLLLFFDYYEIRILNGLCQGVIAAVTIFLIRRQKGVKYASALATSYLLLMPMALAYCLQYSWVFYVSFTALLIYVKNRDFWESGNRYIYYFIVVGAVTIYLDLLTYPLLTWGLLITWWIMLQEKGGTAFAYLKKVVFSGLAWIAGYGGMWIGKWAVGSVVLGENLFAKAISEALLWTVNEGDSAIAVKDRLEAIFINWSTYDYKIYLIVLIVWLLYWVVYGLLRGGDKSPKAPALLLIACSSAVWYMFLAGHTIIHHIFTHRIFGVSIAAFLGMILLSTEGGSLPSERKKHLLSHMAAIVGIGAFSVFFMLLLRDEFTRHNGESHFTQIELSAPAYMTFTPGYTGVTSLDLGFYVVDGTSGWCRVKLSDGDTVLEQFSLPLQDYLRGNFHRIEVGSKLKAGYPYTLLLEPVEIDGSVQLWVTADESMPLPEYGEVTLGGEKWAGQMLAGVTYWCVLTESSRRLLFTAAFMGIIMMILYSGWSVTPLGKKREQTQAFPPYEPK